MLTLMKRRIYLDAAAAYPVRNSARRAFLRALSVSGNPSAPHSEGRKAAEILEEARASIAEETGAKADAVIFTSGATESNALAIVGHIQARISAGAQPETLEVFFSPTQHASVIGAVEEVRRRGVRVREIPLTDGALNLSELAASITPNTALITLDVICGETGARFDTRAVRKIIDARPVTERPVFHVDATQAPLVERIDRTRLGADFISFDAQKIGGVRGIGALIAPRTIPLVPLVEGGGQERGVRSGTPSPALAAAFATALTDAASERDAFTARAAELLSRVRKEMAKMSEVVVNTPTKHAPHILNVSLIGVDADYLVALLDEAGVAVSSRSACESDAEGSRVVLAFTKDAARASSTLRISLTAMTTKHDARMFLRALASSLRFLRTTS